MATFSFFNEVEQDCCHSTLPSVEFDTILKKEDIEAALEESAYDAACRACMENTRNWNAIMKACTITEFAYFEENHTEFIYEGTKLDAFFDKAKQFFESIWKKIQEIFKTAVAQFAAWFKSDKDFLNKYKKLIDTAKANGFGDKEVSIFPYAVISDGGANAIAELKNAEATPYTDEVNNAAEGTDLATLRENIKKFNSDYKTEKLDQLRAGFIKNETSVAAKDFAKTYREQLTGDKADVKLDTAIQPAVDFLEKSDAVKRALNNGLTTAKEQIDAAIRKIDQNQKALKNANENATGDALAVVNCRHSLMQTAIEIDRGAKNVLTEAIGINIDVMKKASRQCKAVCMKALTYSDKSDKDNKRQSVLHTESAMELVNSLVLI